MGLSLTIRVGNLEQYLSAREPIPRKQYFKVGADDLIAMTVRPLSRSHNKLPRTVDLGRAVIDYRFVYSI